MKYLRLFENEKLVKKEKSQEKIYQMYKKDWTDETILEEIKETLDDLEIHIADEDFDGMDSDFLEESLSQISNLYKSEFEEPNYTENYDVRTLEDVAEDIFYSFLGNARYRITTEIENMMKQYIITQVNKLFKYDSGLFAEIYEENKNIIEYLIKLPDDFKRSINSGLWNQELK